MKMILEGSETPIIWEVFRTKFYTEYFPDSVRYDKEIEFLQLVQGSMPVTEYADRKFENGLREDIKLWVKGLRIKEFPTLVEMARVMEKTKTEAEGQQSQLVRSGGPSRSRGGFSSRRAPYPRPSPSSGSKVSSSQPSVHSGQSSQTGGLRCYKCGGPHL
ncbi:uncharacterized protein LOC108319549 [Vigna angularis]|uniref:uncharacterized protein LOC108319549 n=1 Tax=Phaseolus angularis TaxID=3914 RepID=UPI000809B396|nr:uncharacterized protein LOC108319549 [Vigna angularis]